MRNRFPRPNVGAVRTPLQLAAMSACEELIVDFCDLMDEGDVAGALDSHLDDPVFHDVDGTRITGKADAAEWLRRVRFSYPGRATLHVPSNLRFADVTDDHARCRVLVTLYDLTEPDGEQRARARSPDLRGVVAEDIQFQRAGACWRFKERRISFLTGSSPLIAVASR